MRPILGNFQLLFLLAIALSSSYGLVHYRTGVLYTYEYEASTELNNVGVIDTKAEIDIELIEEQIHGSHCRFSVKDVTYMLSDATYGGARASYNESDFSMWFSFLITKHGEIVSVFYDTEDKPEIVVLKKLLIGTLSAKLHSTETTLAKGAPWSYRVNETGHEGDHEATYTVGKTVNGVLFTKTRHGHFVEDADTSHIKTILYDHLLEIPRVIDVSEHFTPPRKKRQRDVSISKASSSVDSLMEETDIPAMKSSSQSKLTYIGQQPTDKPNAIQVPDNLIEDSLKISEIPKSTIPLSENRGYITRNMTCMQMNPSPKSPERSGCFQNLIQIAKRLSTEDIEQFAVAYIKPNATFLNSDEEGEREIAIDVLGAVATEITQGILIDMILLSERPNGSLIMQTLIHFVELDNPPAEVAVEAITRLAFGEVSASIALAESESIDLVHNRALLVLGSMAKTLRASEREVHQQKAEEIVKTMEDNLGVHDHWHHRQIRSALSDEDYNSYIEEKATLIYSLGNAISPTSYEHLLSYVNNSDSHPMLRRSGVHAISKYSHKQAARRLLNSAIHDDDGTVRYLAATEYLRHSHAGDFGHLVDEHGNINVTLYSEERHLSRKKRSFFDGFQVHLQTPSFEWTRNIGTDDVGGSMGLILKNSFDLDIKPLEGSMKVDVYNHAYAKGQIGYIGYEFSMLDAKVCFQGESSYSLNILQDFDFKKIFEMVTQFDRVVKNVIGSIRNAVSTFSKLLSPDSISFSKIFEAFIDAIQDLPNFVKRLTSIAHDMLRRIGKYVGLPDFFYDLQSVIFRISGLFNAVRTDVMELYNSINDAITVTLPWVVEQVVEAVESIDEVIKKLFESPVSAIKDISRFIFKIKGAVSGVLHAKRRIEDACFFNEGSPPYWFNMKDELTDIWEELVAVKNSLRNAGNWTMDGDKIKEFTGIGQFAVQANIVADILGLYDLLEGPIESLKELAEPFLKAYETVSMAITNIKDGYEGVKSGYEAAKTFLNKIFGSKGAKKFPRKITITNCGEGFYPSKTKNTPPGIDLEIRSGSILVSPYTGNVTRTGPSQLTIDVEDEVKNTQVIIDHVNLDSKNHNRTVFKGMRLGVVTKSGCQPNIIHLAMRKMGTKLYIDPTKYIEKRKILTPPWIQHCDEYVLIYKGAAVAGPRSITGGPKSGDESPERTEKPDTTSLSVPERSKRDVTTMQGGSLIDKGKDLLSKLGLANIDDRGPPFNLNMKDTTLWRVFEFLDAAEQDFTKIKLNSTIATLRELLEWRDFRRPETLTDDELRMTSTARGKKSRSASRPTLIEYFREPEERCREELWSYMPNHTFCNFDLDCKGVQCTPELEFFYFPVQVPVMVRLDSCQLQLHIHLGEYKMAVDIIDLVFDGAVYDYDVFQEGIGSDMDPLGLFRSVQIVYNVNAEIVGSSSFNGIAVQLDLQLAICSTKADTCMPFVTVFKGLVLETEVCDSAGDEEEEKEKGSEIEDMSLQEFEEQLSIVNIDSKDVTSLINEILFVVRAKTIEEIATKLLDDFGNEFSNFDVKLKGVMEFGPRNVNFFDRQYPFAVGPVPCMFGFGASGSYGATFSVEAAILSMKLSVTVRPEAGAAAYGSLAIGIPLFYAELQLKGYILTAALPTRADIQFSSFPLDLESRMDLVMIPLKLELRGRCVGKLKIPFVGTIEKVIFDVMIWGYTTRQIEQNIFNKGDLEPDNTPPEFTQISIPEANLDSSKRSMATVTDCTVEQVAKRDEVEPAFTLAVAAGDDKSEVDLTYCVGTYKSGCDILADQTMGGQSVVIAQILPDGVPLHFTVKATNSAKNTAMATCFLPTYDVTLPEARIVPDFYSTSRPDVLRVSAVAYDDSPIVNIKIGTGFGYGIYGDQVIPWTDVTSYSVSSDSESIMITSPLENFTKRRLGRLPVSPYQTASYKTPTGCAQRCLPLSKCISFNYDFGSSGLCELLNRIEGIGTELHESGQFYYFEKLGVGGTMQFSYDNLQLRHADLHYVNMHVINSLGYENIIASRPIVADFDPPSPGRIQNALYEEFSHEQCDTYLLEEWKYKCADETTLPNHRLIIDGPGSATVFNGHEPLVDLLYTRANTYISANWDGFHDDETGIFGYSWAVGTSPCMEDVVTHNDPHSHIVNEKEWTHRGSTRNFKVPILPDGRYYITVRAVNEVDFGGPMATTVCHSTPYTIDTTPPFVNEVLFLGYDEDTWTVSAMYNVSDDLSYIREIDMGLGKSKRDIYIMDWKRYSNTTHADKQHCIPDGLPAWIKIRAINNVDLNTVGHAASPFIVDTSPPTAGEVFDGRVHDHDIDYQNKADEICVSWHSFYDKHSGLEKYTWHVGTSPGDNDTIPYVELEPSTHRICNYSVILTHNTTYYSTITAYNAGHKKLSTSNTTDGVLYDETEPVEGWIKDGLDPARDMAFGSKAASVSANWNEYFDPESNIKEYIVTVWRRHAPQGNSTPPFHIIHDSESIPSSDNSINWHHFHLHHMDYVYVELQTINKALTGIKTETDGYLVDLTVPIFKFLGDGTTLGGNIKYTSSPKELSANWNFEDPESDIEIYRISVRETYGGTTLKIYPKESDSEEVDSSAFTWTSEDLPLINGAHYSIRVTAVNGAGLSNVQDTDGVFVDTTSPIMRLVSIGVLSEDEEEEIIDGFVLQTDTEGIRAYWKATDFESGVVDYLLSIGTSEGATDVKDFTSMGPKEGGYIDGLQLQKYSVEDSGPVYYLTVRAINGAGTESSNMTSSAIRIVAEDKTGLVFDGPEDHVPDESMDGYVDIDYQRETGTVTAQFNGFESEQHGIAHYEWAVGSRPGLDDIQPYISNGILINQYESGLGDGLVGSGLAQSLLQLDPEVTYYTTIRALTGAGNALDSTSDGFTVDTSPPIVEVDSQGILRQNQTVETNLGIYQKFSDSIVDSWHVTEDESEVYFTEFCYGSYPGASDVYSCTDSEGRESTPIALVQPNTDNLPNVITVSSVNKVGLWSKESSRGVTIDTTPPIKGSVVCPSFITTTDDLKCTWSGFYDAESGISHYMFAIGIEEEDDSIYPFTIVAASLNEHMASGPFEHKTYYVTVTAVNNVGESTNSYSQPIHIDETPPIGGQVVELTGVDEQRFDDDNGASERLNCMTLEDCVSKAAVCQRSLDRIFVTWEPFQDAESPIVRYQIAVGTSPGGAQLKTFYDVEVNNRLMAVITGVNLYDVRQAFVSVRGFNAAGLHTTAVSNGIYISRISAGLPPVEGSYVWDGNGKVDLDYQDSNEALFGQWHFDGDPCPKLKYEWSIYKIDGTLVQPKIETTDAFGMNDGFDMKNGETYYLVVRATNLLGYSHSLRSDGITIQLEPLVPRDVRDGDVYGFDLNYQSSITELSANWDAFGVHPGQSTGLLGGQVIERYEVAAGTDQRYPNTRDDIHQFVNVGLNTSHTFTNLRLIPETQTYYMTLRAFAVSTAMVEVTSNGIRVGFGGELLSQGQISIQRYIPSPSSLTLSWSNFKFTMPVLFYTWGIGSNRTTLHSLSCKDLQLSVDHGGYQSDEDQGLQDIFEEKAWTEVGKDTMVEQTGLNLKDKETYTVVVMATDESGHCSLASSDFTVDETTPDAGRLKIGAFEDEEIVRTARDDMLFVSWSNFNDAESGIESYSIALYDGISCGTDEDQVVLQDFIDILPNDTDYNFVDLELKPQTPYFINLRATNNAGLATTVISQPIILDFEQPTVGVVKDGIDFQTDKDYQSSTSTVEGVFLHLPNPHGDSCPSRRFSMATDDTDEWNVVKTRGIWGVDDRDSIAFRQEQLSFNEDDDSLSITLVRDVRDVKMYSGALYHPEPDIVEGGQYQVDILAASGEHAAVTTVVFWDGPDGVLGDFNVPFDDSSWDDDVVEFDPCKVCCLANNTQIEKETSCPCNCTEYLESKTTTFTTVMSTTTVTSTDSQTESATTPPPWQIIEDVDEDDTYKGDDRLKSVPQRSFGFQLHPAVRVGGDTRHFMVLWFRFQNSTEPVKYNFAELDFDPSQAWHTYRLDVINEMDAISVELFTDGKSVMFMSGIPTFSPDAKFILSVWNRDAYVPSFEDVFSPPTATASFRGVRFPPSSDALCKFGEPFRNGDSAIKAFFAGVGSEKFQADVVPFQEIVRPCLPCTNPCESSACDPECSYTTVQTYSVVLRGLSLNSTRSVEEGGELKPIPAVYHLTIKAVTGSGRYVLTSSNGIYVDDTPPVFDYLYHIDVSWSLDQPIKYQGSNTTIAVRWSAYDIGSQVHEYKWAIGSQPNATDVQPFVSVGLETFAVNEILLGVLEDRKTYYVTVVAINRAGLTTTLVTSGVTLMLTPPDVTASNATSECDDNDINTDLVDGSLCGSQSSTGMKWTRVEDDSVDSYLFSIGSSEETEDIFSKLQVGYNASGAVEIKDGLVYIGDKAIANVSGVRDPAADVEVIKNRFHMEPGRTMFSKITVCNKGHKCEEMATSVTTIARKGDALSSPSDGSGPELLLPSDDDVITIKSGQESHKATRKRNINKREDDNSEDEVTLMAGFLSNDDLHDEYASDASRDFKPFIVNPDVTKDKTNRALRNRIKEIVGPSFYITTIGRKPMSEPLNITIGFNVSRLNSDDREKEVKLIFWQTELQEWQDSSDTCAESEQMNRYDLQNGIISIQVCSTENNPKQHLIHRRSPSMSSVFKGPTLFTVASIGPFVNSPPSITSVTDIWMWEDAGTLQFQVAADDDDGDDVIFELEGRPHENDFGVVVLSPDGELSYTPCLDCFGLKSVQIVASEDRTDNYIALTTSKTLNIDVRGINDNPDIFLVTDPLDVTDGMVPSQFVTTEERKEDNDDRNFKAVVGAFDPDTFDTLTLLFDLPQHGTLQTGVQHTAVEFINDDCLPLSNITDDYLGHNNSDVDTVLFPCKLPIPHTADRLAWVFSTLTYIPEKDFHGEDSFKLNAVDQSGAHSDVITVKVYVLANPCLNGGVCNGTESDPDCTSTDRAKGFDGYSCACPPGLIGESCLTDYNECDSNPCPSNFTCIDQINSFACYCENVYWPCGGGGRFSPTVIIAAVCSGIILAVVVIIIARRLYLKKKKQLKIAPEADALNKAFDLTYGNFDDSLELKEKKCDEVIDNNNNEEDDSSEPTAEIPETAVDDDVDTGDFDDVEEIEATEPVKLLDDTGDTTTKETEPKILMSVEQRFGFVDRPVIPKRAWGRVKSARMTFNNKVSPFDEMDDEESQA